VKKSPVKVGIGTVEKLTIENMGIAFGILSLGYTASEIQMGVIYPLPLRNCNVRFKKYRCNTRVNNLHVPSD